jgi:hypothetical protein
MIRAARAGNEPGSAEALASLCEAYWYPLYFFVRRLGHEPEEARDLTQAYFLKLLQEGYLEEVLFDLRGGPVEQFPRRGGVAACLAGVGHLEYAQEEVRNLPRLGLRAPRPFQVCLGVPVQQAHHDAEADGQKEEAGQQRRRQLVPGHELSDLIRGAGRPCQDRLVFQVPPDVGRQLVGRTVSAVPLLLQGLHGDQVQIAGEPPRQRRDVGPPRAGRSRRPRAQLADPGAGPGRSHLPDLPKHLVKRRLPQRARVER